MRQRRAIIASLLEIWPIERIDWTIVGLSMMQPSRSNQRDRTASTNLYTPNLNMALTGIYLSTYPRGRYDLPEPTRTTPPANSLLAQEASAVTYNPDTDTLFVVGDSGTSIVQVAKTRKLIDFPQLWMFDR